MAMPVEEAENGNEGRATADFWGTSTLVAGEYTLTNDGPLKVCRGAKCYFFGETDLRDEPPDADVDHGGKAAISPSLGLVALERGKDDQRRLVDIYDIGRRKRIRVIKADGDLAGFIGPNLSLWSPGDVRGACAGFGATSSDPPSAVRPRNGDGDRFCSTWTLLDAKTGRRVASLVNDFWSTHALARVALLDENTFATILRSELQRRDVRRGKLRQQIPLATLIPDVPATDKVEVRRWIEQNIVLVTGGPGELILSSTDGRILVIDPKTFSVARIISPPPCSAASPR